MYQYSLQISSIPSTTTAAIENILGKKSNDPDTIGLWSLTINSFKCDTLNIINSFLNILDGKYEKLKKIGVNKDDLSIWILYEYEFECKIQLHSEILKKLSDNKITLCISCFNKNGSDYILF